MYIDLFLRHTAAATPNAGDQKSSSVFFLTFALLRSLTEAAANIENVRGALLRISLLSFSNENSRSFSLVGLLKTLGDFLEQSPEHSLSISSSFAIAVLALKSDSSRLQAQFA